jgi:hypothetical protein
MDDPVVMQQPHQAQAAAPARRTPTVVRFERSEARLRDDQVDDLAILARRLDRARKRLRLGGDRITGSTLIRVAADLLLSRQDELHGSTEADLLDSLRKQV